MTIREGPYMNHNSNLYSIRGITFRNKTSRLDTFVFVGIPHKGIEESEYSLVAEDIAVHLNLLESKNFLHVDQGFRAVRTPPSASSSKVSTLSSLSECYLKISFSILNFSSNPRQTIDGGISFPSCEASGTISLDLFPIDVYKHEFVVLLFGEIFSVAVRLLVTVKIISRIVTPVVFPEFLFYNQSDCQEFNMFSTITIGWMCLFDAQYCFYFFSLYFFLGIFFAMVSLCCSSVRSVRKSSTQCSLSVLRIVCIV